MANPVASATVPPIATMGVTHNPLATQEVDETAYPMTLDRHGAVQVSPVHDARFVASARNNMFRISGAGTTGVAILAAGGTTSGFCFGSLAGSGINMCVHRLRVIPLTATAVVGVIGLEYGVCPVSTTYVTGVVGSPIGNGAVPACKAWDAVTIVANAWLMGLPYFIPATTNINQPGVEYDFKDGLLIGPGYAVNVCTTPTTQGANKSLVEIDWSEWLV
jgi:hypothetical protein